MSVLMALSHGHHTKEFSLRSSCRSVITSLMGGSRWVTDTWVLLSEILGRNDAGVL